MRIRPLLILGFLAIISVPTFANELKMIMSVFRHGHRAPDQREKSYYPLDPNSNMTWYPEGWGGLTIRGKKAAYELGLFMKKRYGVRFGDVFLNSKVIFRSSTYERTMMTAQLVAAAVFPPSDIQRWNRKLDWQPIPVYSDNLVTKSLYTLPIACKKLLDMRSELESTDEDLLKRSAKLKEVFTFVSSHAGTKLQYKGTAGLYHYLYAQFSQNVKLAEWTKHIFPRGQLEKITSYDYVIQSYNMSMIQLNGGPWIREFLGNVDSYLNGTDDGNLTGFFYGAHEANLAAIMVALEVFDEHVPYYCSALIFEIHEISDELYLELYYRNRGALQGLTIPRCGNFTCPLIKFRELVAEMITVDDTVTACDEG